MSDTTSIALVTGANRGIGFEVARQLMQQDMTVIVGARTAEKAQEAFATLTSEGGGAGMPQALDVSSDESVAACAEDLRSRFGRIDVLINNAGSHFDPFHTATAVDLNFVREAMETNVFGAWRTTQALLPLLRQSAHPRVVNVSSQAASLSEPFMPLGATGLLPAYATSKAALNALTQKLANELKEEGFLINAIGPGLTATFPGAEEMGARPVSEGAASIVWGATLPDDGPTGGFFRDGQPLAW